MEPHSLSRIFVSAIACVRYERKGVDIVGGIPCVRAYTYMLGLGIDGSVRAGIEKKRLDSVVICMVFAWH